MKQTLNKGQIIWEYADGKSLHQIGIIHRCSHGRVKSILVAAGVQLRPKHQKKPHPRLQVRNEEIAELDAQGWTYVEIGKVYGLTRQGVAIIMKRRKQYAAANQSGLPA